METLLKTKVFDVVKLPNGYVGMHHPGSVAVLPILANGSLVLVKQKRPVIGDDQSIECIAGKLDVENESPVLCAARELEEEAGYKSAKINKIAEICPSPGCSDEIIHIFTAKELTSCERPKADDVTEPWVVGRDEVMQMIFDGRIRDAKTIIAVLMS